MDSFLAYKSNRTYVFYDFSWPDKHYPWPIHKYREWTPHTPLNAFFSGPTAGSSWGPGDSAPRAISDKWFDVVCPKSERRYINTHDVKPAIYWEDGSVIFEHWRKILTDAPERCIEIIPPPPETDGTPQVFDLHVWGSGRSLSLWEDFKNSPVSQLLSASPIVKLALEVNRHLFTHDDQAPLSSIPSSTPFGSTLSVHIRRGDYKSQCRHFWTWSSSFYNWNLLPFLPDRFNPPPGLSWGANIPENLPIFLERCFPEIPTIIKRVRDVKKEFMKSAKPGESRVLKVIYIMTNDHTPWLDDLIMALAKDGWEVARTTADLTLTAEQKDVGVAIDMEIGRQSAVFLGNGVSSSFKTFYSANSGTVVLLHEQHCTSKARGWKGCGYHTISLITHSIEIKVKQNYWYLLMDFSKQLNYILCTNS